MNTIFKATLLLLCAVAWARAAALPASTPCPLDRNVTPNSLVQYRQMEDTFLSILNDTRHLRDRAQVYFKNNVSFTLWAHTLAHTHTHTRTQTHTHTYTHTHTHTHINTDIQQFTEIARFAVGSYRLSLTHIYVHTAIGPYTLCSSNTVG